MSDIRSARVMTESLTDTQRAFVLAYLAGTLDSLGQVRMDDLAQACHFVRTSVAR